MLMSSEKSYFSGKNQRFTPKDLKKCALTSFRGCFDDGIREPVSQWAKEFKPSPAKSNLPHNGFHVVSGKSSNFSVFFLK